MFSPEHRLRQDGDRVSSFLDVPSFPTPRVRIAWDAEPPRAVAGRELDPARSLTMCRQSMNGFRRAASVALAIILSGFIPAPVWGQGSEDDATGPAVSGPEM